MARSGYNREEAAEKREAELAEMHEKLAKATVEMANSGEWKRWLDFASRFHRYSFNNTMLIMLQRPDATMCAGYKAWQANGRQVTKGESGIRVLAPVTYQKPKLKPDGTPVLDAKGKPVKESKLVGFKPTSTFDVSQTTGEPLPHNPTVPTLLRGEAPAGLWDALAQQVADAGFRLERNPTRMGENGYTSYGDKVISVRPDVDDAQAVKTLAHELGHAMLHEPLTGESAFECRGTKEVEAESVAYLVAAANGLDTSEYTFAYVSGWAQGALAAAPRVDGQEPPTLESVIADTATRVLKTAHRIIEQLPVAEPDVAEVALERSIENPEKDQTRDDHRSRPERTFLQLDDLAGAPERADDAPSRFLLLDDDRAPQRDVGPMPVPEYANEISR